jgi:hypothetical protein
MFKFLIKLLKYDVKENEEGERSKRSPLSGHVAFNKTLAIVLGNIIGLLAIGAIGSVVGIFVSSSSKFRLK